MAGKNLCVGGMCAIVRFLIRRRAAVAKRRGRGFPGEKLLGYQGELCVVVPCGEESEKEPVLLPNANGVFSLFIDFLGHGNVDTGTTAGCVLGFERFATAQAGSHYV